MSRHAGGRVDPALIDQAAAWMARLWADDASAQDHEACRRWRTDKPEHERAWQCIMQVSGKFAALPASQAHASVLEQARQAPVSRRQFLQWAGLAGAGLVAAGYGVSSRDHWQASLAGYRTRVGEVRRVSLEDGTRLVLNTDTALDVDYGPQHRRILLHRGEVSIDTAVEMPRRRFAVSTGHGELIALGTTFNVRQEQEHTRVAVLEGAVQVQPAQSGQGLRLEAGQQARFSRNSLSAIQSVEALASSWRDGLLVAEQMRLADLLGELARYRRGFVNCSPAVADLRISGVFSLTDTDRALHSLAQSLPVEVRYRTRFWVNIVARGRG